MLKRKAKDSGQLVAVVADRPTPEAEYYNEQRFHELNRLLELAEDGALPLEELFKISAMDREILGEEKAQRWMNLRAKLQAQKSVGKAITDIRQIQEDLKSGDDFDVIHALLDKAYFTYMRLAPESRESVEAETGLSVQDMIDRYNQLVQKEYNRFLSELDKTASEEAFDGLDGFGPGH